MHFKVYNIYITGSLFFSYLVVIGMGFKFGMNVML